jgi:hypothetical protein
VSFQDQAMELSSDAQASSSSAIMMPVIIAYVGVAKRAKVFDLLGNRWWAL